MTTNQLRDEILTFSGRADHPCRDSCTVHTGNEKDMCNARWELVDRLTRQLRKALSNIPQKVEDPS
jgi:hypothetical protein